MTPKTKSLSGFLTKTLSAVKMKLFELNLLRIELFSSWKRKDLEKILSGNYFTTQEKLRIIVTVVNNDQESLFSFQPWLL